MFRERPFESWKGLSALDSTFANPRSSYLQGQDNDIQVDLPEAGNFWIFLGWVPEFLLFLKMKSNNKYGYSGGQRHIFSTRYEPYDVFLLGARVQGFLTGSSRCLRLFFVVGKGGFSGDRRHWETQVQP